MRIVTQKEFLAMPVGTVFCHIRKPGCRPEPDAHVKTHQYFEEDGTPSNDWCEDTVYGECTTPRGCITEIGGRPYINEMVQLDFIIRHGLYPSDDQTYAVYTDVDMALIAFKAQCANRRLMSKAGILDLQAETLENLLGDLANAINYVFSGANSPIDDAELVPFEYWHRLFHYVALMGWTMSIDQLSELKQERLNEEMELPRLKALIEDVVPESFVTDWEKCKILFGYGVPFPPAYEPLDLNEVCVTRAIARCVDYWHSQDERITAECPLVKHAEKIMRYIGIEPDWINLNADEADGCLIYTSRLDRTQKLLVGFSLGGEDEKHCAVSLVKLTQGSKTLWENPTAALGQPKDSDFLKILSEIAG